MCCWQSFYFKRLQKVELLRVAHLLEPVSWKRGDVLAEQGKRPSHVLVFSAGEARLSVQLVKGVGVEVALLSLAGEVINGEALFDDSSCIGTFTATVNCEGYRLHKREAQKVLRTQSCLAVFKNQKEQRKTFVRERVVACLSAMKPTQRKLSSTRPSRLPTAAVERSLTTKGKSAALADTSMGALSQSAMARRHRLDSRSAIFKSEVEASLIASRSESSLFQRSMDANRRRSLEGSSRFSRQVFCPHVLPLRTEA